MKKCRACRQGELVIARKNHRYIESGLSNVVLQDVEVRSCPQCGDEQLVLPRVTELYRAIALACVSAAVRACAPSASVLARCGYSPLLSRARGFIERRRRVLFADGLA